jgi:hypothetical protein
MGLGLVKCLRGDKPATNAWSPLGRISRANEGTQTKYNLLSNNSGREYLSLSTKRIVYCVSSFIQAILGKELAVIHSILNL